MKRPVAATAWVVVVWTLVQSVETNEDDNMDISYRIIESQEVIWAWGKLEGVKGSARYDDWPSVTRDHVLYDNANLTKLTFLNVQLPTPLPVQTLPLQVTDVAIANCDLTSFPPDMLHMTHLQKLDLNRNNLVDFNITALGPSTSFPSLQQLMLQENALRTFDIAAPSLVQLDLSGNQLTALPSCVYTMMELLELYLANNSIPQPLHVSATEFEFLSGLDYFYMDSVVVDSSACMGASQLHALKGNKICVTSSPPSSPHPPPAIDRPSTTWSYSTLSWVLLVSGVLEAVVGVAVYVAYRNQRNFKCAAPPSYTTTTTASSGERERLLSVEHVLYASMEAWTSSTTLSQALEAEALRLDCDAVSLDVRLAQGGYGEVWRGHYHQSVVAIKLLLPEKRAPSDIEAFMREIVLLARL